MDVNKVREDFPILSRKVNGNKIIYFDNAATSQTPIKVINKILIIIKNITLIFIEVYIL